MNNYNKLTNEELNDFTSRVVVQLEPTLTQQVMSLILELSEYRNKIENGTLIEPKYPLYSIVFIIDYINEEGYSVYGGKPIVRECFVTSITQMIKEEGKLLYRVQPKDLPNDVLEGEVEHCEYWERAWWEKDLFLTKAEAEKKLKELRNEI